MFLTQIKQIKNHSNSVYSLLLLKDGRIASCSWDSTLKIYNPNNDYHCDITLGSTFSKEYIISICQLDNGNLVSGSSIKNEDWSYSSFIKIWSITTCKCVFTINYANRKVIVKVISIPNNKIVSCSLEKDIKVWNEYSDTPIKILKGHQCSLRSIIYINNRNLLISSSSDNTLRMWNMKTFQCINIINGINGFSANSLYQIDNDRIIVGNVNYIFIVNINNCIIEKSIKDDKLGNIRAFEIINDEYILGGGPINFVLIKRDTFEHKFTKDVHKGTIDSILKIGNKTILTCSNLYSIISIWKF